ncbi:MAG: hypothetical protein JWQ04_2923 [Pedosphaera sp.]|nr:hypothetical protein [Pedosphaera sp.]
MWLIPMAALTLLGCHKNSNPQAPPTPETGADASAPAPAQAADAQTPNTPPAPSPAVAANAENKPRENVNGEVNAFLTQQLRIFIQQNNRMPQSFAEFARARLDSLPHAPEGQKWVIDTSTQEVKAVAAK